MTQSMLTPLRLRAGIWEGVLTTPTANPRIEALFQGTPLPDLHVTALPDQPGCHIVKLALPSTLISDGVQTVILRDAETRQTLGHIAVQAGIAPDDDLRAELDLLRAELDLLKRAFRRHCTESGHQD
ncbi:hypothetical protein GCM10010991_28290 [Gemmobacter aquaticus]|uniref:Uncharacterized protein n=1 Tax=Gemmobacter aquaticus TaxID=490185 RepID=A0A917YL84_9RHOB|nr:hypothetical protein [Gemmobacter aquaticus]GGO35660.1 hypothetical protein GCM10010991_28290 [Gemmobacter aquaticus]